MTVPAWLRRTMLVVDIGFIAYWLAIATSVLPASLMFDGYADPRVQAWNWAFLGEFELLWWAPNAFLLIVGVTGLSVVVARASHPAERDDDTGARLVA